MGDYGNIKFVNLFSNRNVGLNKGSIIKLIYLLFIYKIITHLDKNIDFR